MRWGVILRWSRCRSRHWSRIWSRRRCSTLRICSSESKNRWPVQRADVAQSSRLSGSATSKICWALVPRRVGSTRPCCEFCHDAGCCALHPRPVGSTQLRCRSAADDAHTCVVEEVPSRGILGLFFQSALVAHGLAVSHAADDATACLAEDVPRRSIVSACFHGPLVVLRLAVGHAVDDAAVIDISGGKSI